MKTAVVYPELSESVVSSKVTEPSVSGKVHISSASEWLEEKAWYGDRTH